MRIIGFESEGHNLKPFWDCMDAFRELGHETEICAFPLSGSSVNIREAD
jgi:hypothetical protein